MDNEAALEELHTLVPGLRQLEPDALSRTYELTADMLASIALGIVRDPDLAEDVVQDVFVKFVGSVAELRGDDGYAVRAWLVTATRNRCIDVLRSARQQREEQTDVLPDEEIGSESPEAVVAEGELDPALASVLAQLTDDQRDALVLRYVADLSGSEIGQILDRNRAAVYTLLRRAERRARSLLEDASDRRAADRLH